MPWQAGQSGNPRGAGSHKVKLDKAFHKRYLGHFQKHGIAAIEKVYAEDPVAYLKIGVSLLPKQHNVAITHGFLDVLSEVSAHLSAQKAAQGSLSASQPKALPHYPQAHQGLGASLTGSTIDGECEPISFSGSESSEASSGDTTHCAAK